MYYVIFGGLDDDDDEEDEEEEDEDDEGAEKGSAFSIYSHTPDDLFLDPAGQMVFETKDMSGKEPGQGQGQGRVKEKVVTPGWICLCFTWVFTFHTILLPSHLSSSPMPSHYIHPHYFYAFHHHRN